MTSDVFVPGDGFLYVAPTLIVHYVEGHQYAPPDEFVRAVIACPSMRSPEYMTAVEKNGPSFKLDLSTLKFPPTPPHGRSGS